jgi:hypothetical protein
MGTSAISMPACGPKIEKIPVDFLANRSLVVETGSRVTASTATILKRTALCRDFTVRKREEFAAFCTDLCTIERGSPP